MTARAATSRMAYLDALRGCAAFAVAVLWHYQQFVPQGAAVDSTAFPLSSFWPARLGYAWGWLAVDFFFLLSGIVFARTYARRLSERQVSGRQFFLLRFSRLYPIHVATLIVTALLAWTYKAQFGAFPIYSINDAKHFALNTLFLQRSGLDRGYSFNGPAWSLSIEAAMYLLFYLSCRFGVYRVAAPLLAVAGILGTAILSSPTPTVSLEMTRGLAGFFLGCVLHDHVIGRSIVVYRVLAALPVLWVVIWKLGRLDVFVQSWIYFVAIIVAVSQFAVLSRMLAVRPLAILGDISLSTYLVHVPIQMGILLAWRSHGGWPPVSAPWFFVAWTIAVLSVAVVTHYGFERPVQSALRRRFGVTGAAT